MTYGRIIIADHAGQRMYERSVSYDEVVQILLNGEIIEKYPDDFPYPSELRLGFCGSRTLHVVSADVHKTQTTIVITVYEPDPTQWQSDFRRRKRK